MADFNFYINRQGIQGRKGDKGDTGFSPTISVGTDTLNEYKLIIANEVNSFETPNLRGNINVLDNGGTYLRYDAETQQISAQSLDAATSTTVGGVLMSTASDIETMGDNTVITPANLADALPVYLQGEGAVSITQDEETSKTKINVDLSSVDELKSRVSAAEAEIVGIQADVADIDSDISTLNSVTASHTTSISAINNNIADLNNNKVAKTDFATTETAGIVKVDGTTITSTKDGTISANLNYTLPTASTTQLGGVKVDGTTITVDENGVITSVGGGSTGDVTAAGNNTFTGSNIFVGNSLNVGDGNSYYPVAEFDGQHVHYKYRPGGSSHVVKIGSGSIPISVNSILTTQYNSDEDKYYGVFYLNQDSIVSSDGSVTIDKTPQGIDIKASGGGGAAIDDENISTTTVYSSDKTVNLATSLVDNAMITLNQTKQDTLVSGTNIKTINGQSVLGEGNITINGGGEAPANMVTTDTRQTITEIKTFTNSIPMFFGEANKSNYCGRISQTTGNNRYLSIYGGGNYTLEVGQVKIGYEGTGNYPTIGGVLIKSTPTYDTNIKTDIGLKLGSANNRCSITGDAGQIKLTANAIYPDKGYLKIGSDALTYVDNSGTSHDLLASGSGSTDITSSDTSITVTKSDAGVDIVANKDIVTGYAFPSNRYVDLTLGASDSNYIAPADGYVSLIFDTSADFCFFHIYDTLTSLGTTFFTTANTLKGLHGMLPVRSGSTFKIQYSGITVTQFRFVYAEGSEQ